MSRSTRLPSSWGRTESFQENYPGVMSRRRRSPRKCPGQSNHPCLSWSCLFLTTPDTREPWAHTSTVASQEDQVTMPITQRSFTGVGNIHTQKELSQKMFRKLPAESINCTKKRLLGLDYKRKPQAKPILPSRGALPSLTPWFLKLWWAGRKFIKSVAL